MPRGYLKHDKDVAKKKARGGSSGSRYADDKDSDPPRDRSAVDDFVIDAPPQALPRRVLVCGKPRKNIQQENVLSASKRFP